METKHTPGPWKAHPIEMNCGIPYTPVAAKTLLAKVYSEAYGNHAESEANARLIAAAPELLEALQAIMRCSKESGYLFKDSSELYAARAAIAKATT